MQQMTQFHNNPQTMSSREIADLTGKRHDNVLQLVRKLHADQILSPEFKETPFNGRLLPFALLNKRDSLVLVARLSPEFTARIVDRWQELEGQQQSPQPKLPQNYLEALECLLNTEKQRQAADDEARRLQVVCNTMAAQFSPGETAAQFCRQLNGVNTQQVQKWLAEQGWLIAVFGGGFQVSSKGRDGYFAEKHGDVEGRKTVKAALTRKGAKWLYKQYLDGRLPMKATWDRKFTHCLFDGEVA